MPGIIPYSGGGAWGGGAGGLVGARAASANVSDPVYLPATKAGADDNTLVCEFRGGANTNETGAGLGLSGADLVFTQVGGVPAASGDYRALVPGKYFQATAAMIAAWANQPEYTYALKFVSLTPADTKRMFSISGTGTGSLFYYLYTLGFVTNILALDTAFYRAVSVISPLPNTTSPTWLCVWRKNGNVHVGWKTQDALPTGWDEFPQNQRGVISSIPQFAETWSAARNIVNGISTEGASYSIGTVVASKIGLAAAPV